MDKYEFNIKVEQIKKMVSRGDYGTAMKIADTIDWHRVRNASLLSMILFLFCRFFVFTATRSSNQHNQC